MLTCMMDVLLFNVCLYSKTLFLIFVLQLQGVV